MVRWTTCWSVALVVLLFGCIALPLHAQGRSETNEIRVVTGLEHGQQRESCAACVQMVVGAAGYHAVQYPQVLSVPGFSVEHILKQFTVKTKEGEIPVTLTVEDGPLNPVTIVGRIDQGQPILAAFADSPYHESSHVVLIYGYTISPQRVFSFRYIDPRPGEGRKIVAWGDWTLNWHETLVLTFQPRFPERERIDQAALQALAMVGEITGKDTFHLDETAKDSTAYFTHYYQNTDPHRSLRITVRAHVGTYQRPEQHDKQPNDILPHVRKDFTATIPPLQTVDVTGSLRFPAISERIPYHFAEVVACSFVMAVTSPAGGK